MSRAQATLPDGSSIELIDDRWSEIERELAGLGDAEPARLVYAAAHIVMRDSYASVSHSPESPGKPGEIAEHIDWEATMRFREHLISRGFGIAEAMDTAQRYEIGWDIARELIERCGNVAPPMGFIAGAGTDQTRVSSPAEIVDAMVEQCAVIRSAGGWPMLLAQPWLSLNLCDEETYVDVYSRVIRQAESPLFIHWLGPMFLPALKGYFPGNSFERIMRVDPAKVRGCKLSMLDAELERTLRIKLAKRDQIMLTGDDFRFGKLMRGQPERWTEIDGRRAAVGNLSHGLLGVFDGVAAPASIALRALAHGRDDLYSRIMAPSEVFGQVVFEAPTDRYKVGLAYLAWVNGHQSNSMLANHIERSRNAAHLSRMLRAANECGAITDAHIASERLASGPR